MSNAVICLDDSSDDEEVVEVAFVGDSTSSTRTNQRDSINSKGSNLASRKPQPKTNNKDSNAGGNDVVELLLDDSDDDEELERAKKESLASLRGHSSSSSSSAKPPRGRKVSLSQSPANPPKLGSDFDSDSDSDSDDPLLSLLPNLKRDKKMLPASQESTIGLSQSSSLSSASSSSVKKSKSVVQNPYKKKETPAKTLSTNKPNTTTAAGSTSLMNQNPYTPRMNTSNASKESTISSSSTSVAKVSKPVVNPYLKKTPSKTSTTNNCGSFVNHPTISRNNNLPIVYGSKEDVATSFPTGQFPYPSLLDRSRKYDDLRARYLLALWKNARSLTLHSHERPKLDQTASKIVSLALWKYPLRSLEDFCHRFQLSDGSSKAMNETRYKILQEQLDKGGLQGNRDVFPIGSSECGSYCSIAEACLVAMATEVDKRRMNSPEAASQTSLRDHLKSKEMWMTLSYLIPEIDKRLHPRCPSKMFRAKDEDGGVAYYTTNSTRSAEYKQIEKLKLSCTSHMRVVNKEQNNGHEGYIKERKHKKQVVFELSPLGYQTAKWIQARVYPEPPGYYRTSHTASLESVKAEYKDICLGVDMREGGFGSQKSVLHKMLNKLDMKGLPYFVGSLDIGDYAFFWTGPGPHQGKLCPVIVERKSVQDVAQSISDGRWVTQKHRMYHGQYVFGYENCRMAYLIEGKEEKQLVSNDYVGHRKFGVTHPDLVKAIEALEEEGFDVLRSTSAENSMFVLSSWAAKIGEEVRNGKIKIQYTFQQFKAEVKKIPSTVDFSRIAKDHMKHRKERERQSASQQAAQMNAESEEEIVEAHCGEKNDDSDYNSPFKKPPNGRGGSVKQDSFEAIDLCSDDDDDEDHQNAGASSAKPAKRQPEEKAAQSTRLKNSGTKLRYASRSHANIESNEPFRKQSAALKERFGIMAEDSENESDEDIIIATKNIQKQKKRDKKRQQKRKREQERAKNPKNQKMTPEVVGKSGSTNKKQKKESTTTPCSAQTRSPRSDPKSKQSAQASKDKKEDNQPPAGNFEEWSSAQLKAKCEEYGLTKTGKKADLIERLKGPKPPSVWLERKRKGEYVPARHNTCATAILVALHLHEQEVGAETPGLSKDELYAKAEELEISENPFSGGTTQQGPFHYDGWASMSSLLKGDPPLVVQKKRNLYKLTTSGPLAGIAMAEAMHVWCHEHNVCKNCGCGVVD